MEIFEERLKKYFENNKKNIKKKEILISIGNEGCDLDSFISSLIIGYSENAIQIVNMKKEIFLCKDEINYICKTFKININNLIFLERPIKKDIYFLIGKNKIYLKEKKIRLILLDHNKPISELKDCKIEMIIDHHKINNEIKNCNKIFINTDVGSNCTIVSKYLENSFFKKNEIQIKNSFDKNIEIINKENNDFFSIFAKLLVLPIIIDTNNFIRRTSEIDIFEYNKLLKQSKIKKKEIKKICKKIKKLRKKDEKYKTEIILQKDFKIYVMKDIKFGSSTVKYNFKEWIDREEYKKKIEEKKNNYKNKNININKKNILKKSENKIKKNLLTNEFKNHLKNFELDFLFVIYKKKNERFLCEINFPYIKEFSKKYNFNKLFYRDFIYYKIPEEFSRKILIPLVKDFINEIK